MGRNFVLKLFVRQLASAKVIRRNKQELVFNEVNIQMIDRRLQQLLFAKRIYSYELSKEACEKLRSHGINAIDRREGETSHYVDLPPFLGSNIKEHFELIASDLSKPYLQLIGRLSLLPEIPKNWKLLSGWTAYTKDSYFRVSCPPDDILVFDTEVLVNEGHAPVIAVAASPNFWYLWVSPRLLSSMRSTNSVTIDDLIRFYSDGSALSSPKCIIGHFVSYDRARIFEEYLIEPTGLRFLDTMSLHICVSGLTSTQRNLKLASDKHLYNNKLWKDFVAEHNAKRGSNDPESLDWIKDASLNSLLDVFKFYCQKEPYQNKELRAVFEKGSRGDVIDNFQALATYCANDVKMTFETFRNLWKLYQERFPHPATFYGLLEMGSMYLPINSSWIDFQERANQSYDDLNTKQKVLLQRLAEDALQKHNGSDKSYEKDPWLWDLDWSKPKKPANKSESAQILANLPKWYRELIPKPIKDNYKSGPALITAQMKIAPKLLRLCWKGLPLHYDQILKWGTLIPGRVPKPVGDPRYYEQKQSDESTRSQILPVFKVTKMSATGPDELIFPYREYLKYWTKEMEERLCGVNSRRAFETRANPDARDDLLLDELRRSVEVMPLDLDTVNHLVSSLKKISDNDRGEQVKSKNSLPPVYENLGELQAKGALFWGNKDRYETDHSVKWISASRRKKLRRSATDTINPEIPTCWFCPLPNEAGTGLPVGSPLSKPFQVHIASGRLYSSPTAGGGEDHSADQILRDRIRASFWQSYSKRVMSQMYVFLETNLLPPTVQTALRNGKVPFGRRYGAILPQVIAAGTISRRAVEPLWLTASNAERERLGSEIKALVQAPPGFCLVGADVDSQEMWIASLIGDSVVGFQGGTPYGWMTLEGSKAKGTDLHTKTANLIGIKRNEAKILNYARLYGSGLEFTKHLLSKFQSNLRPEEASLKAEKLMRATKGHRVPVHMGKGCKEEAETRYIWKDGTESCVFNALEAIARSPEPRTPVLGAQITKTLTPTVVKDDFLPSRINWVVQSSAVDYLHCLLVFMAWLIKKYSLRARLCISIHDEVRYLCDQRCADQMALALQISNLLTRALFAFQLGMHDLPESVAYFSSVEVDTCLRKDPSNDCKTPSNPDGLEITYNIPKGRSFTITEIIERTGGAMEPFDSEAREPATNVI
uniref:Mitochondrial DNA polymerase catalytic subunit n=1 Tax=Echinococcus granulosus TaxID=6210 RepID=A0A068WP15_ECHGR|nr:DNA polymerase subunit gamma [Echinococcus granulosus]